MSRDASISFPPFLLDLSSQRLWRGPDEVALTPRAFEMLSHLSARPGRLVSKAELQQAVWGDTRISPETIRSTLRELRRALGEQTGAPAFIETVHGRGYRFIAATLRASGGDADASGGERAMPTLVGREAASRELRAWLAEAVRGRRQIGFVVGPPGIGKTALTEAFLATLRHEAEALCVHGQCISRYGGAEPYMPVLEALARLCRQAGGRRWTDLLARHAPTWLAEMPDLLDSDERTRLEASVVRIDRHRMLRELADALDAITAQQPLVLLLEDLHWSDTATLDAIEALARRTEPARLLVLGTHRPVAPDDGHAGSRLTALRAELRLHDLYREIPLAPLTAADVGEYLEARFPGVEALEEFVHERSGGTPLIMVGYANQLLREERLVETDRGWRLEGDLAGLGIPDGVRQMIEYQIARLAPAAARALETASVAGLRFDAATLAAADPTLAAVEEHLAPLTRTRTLIEVDGAGMRFTHALHQEVLYERVPPERRAELHRKLGAHLEHVHRDDTPAVAAELAMHFERGGERYRAVRRLGQTAQLAIQRSAHEAAARLLHRAVGLLAAEPDGPLRRQAEFGLLARLGTCLTMTKGYVDPEVHDVFGRAFELSAEMADDTPELMTVLAGLCGFYELRGEHATAAEIADQQLRLAHATGDAYDRVVASLSRSIVCFTVGKYDEAARDLRACLNEYDAERHGPFAKSSATDVGVQAHGHASLVLGGLGHLTDAAARSLEAITLADRSGHVPSRILARFYAMLYRQFLRDVDGAAAEAEACLALSTEHGFPYYVPAALVIGGWAMAERGRAAEGAAQAAQGVAILRDAGAVLGQPLFQAMLAEAHGCAGDTQAGLAAVAEGLGVVEATGEVASASFLHWAHAKLLLQRDPAPKDGSPQRKVENCLARAMRVAESCGARMQVVGPTTSLARMRAIQGRAAEAVRLIERSIDGLPSTVVAPVLSDARALLATLRAGGDGGSLK